MKLELCALVPHPPILLPELGDERSEQVSLTHRSMENLARTIDGLQPETIIVISPHGPAFADFVAVVGGDSIEGHLGQFGAPEVRQMYSIDQGLVRAVVATCHQAGLPAASVPSKPSSKGGGFGLDHGMLVPLQYLWRRGLRPQLVPIGVGLLPFLQLYRVGMSIRKAIEALEPTEGRAVILASGDLSHRLTPGAPAGYSPQGVKFDRWLVERLQGFDVPSLLGVDRNALGEAGECGFGAILMMVGALDGLDVAPKVLSYEGPFGVGYAVAEFRPSGASRDSVYDELLSDQKGRAPAGGYAQAGPVAVAQEAVEMWVTKGQTLGPVDLPGCPGRAAVFVSIKRGGELRGCIGTTAPTQRTLSQEIVQNAIGAAVADPRFSPIGADELPQLTYSVDILSPPESIEGPEDLDPARYGVIVTSGRRSGLLLPDLEGVEAVSQQVAIASRKAGIREGEPLRLQRFEVVRYL